MHTYQIELAVAMHQSINDDPCVLFVQQKTSKSLNIPIGSMMGKEQPNRCGLRIINSTFGLGLTNARLRCYIAYVSEQDNTPKVILYHTLKMTEEEISQIELALENKEGKFVSHRWVSINKEFLDNEFDADLRRNWKTIRQCIASNYNKRI